MNRSFIEEALKAAIERLKSDAAVDPVVRETTVRLDKGTEGFTGSPPIADTILGKIQTCTAFVADLTLVGESLALLQDVKHGRKRFFPNPNVLIDKVMSLRCHGHDHIIGVLNTAFGESHTDNLPFDLRHLRWPIKYHLPPDADSSQRKATLTALVFKLGWSTKLDFELSRSRQIWCNQTILRSRKSLSNDPAVFS